MAKTRTLSRKFLKGHLKEGQPTYFVEKLKNALWGFEFSLPNYHRVLMEINQDKIKSNKITEQQIWDFCASLNTDISDEKLHTIRGGDHFKKGDKIQLAVWSGKPYQSPQIRICRELEVKEVYDFEIKNGYVLLNNHKVSNLLMFDSHIMIHQISTNDGLSVQDFKDWFKYPSDFSGQVICWVDPKY